jgi:hypothetical protein
VHFMWISVLIRILKLKKRSFVFICMIFFFFFHLWINALNIFFSKFKCPLCQVSACRNWFSMLHVVCDPIYPFNKVCLYKNLCAFNMTRNWHGYFIRHWLKEARHFMRISTQTIQLKIYEFLLWGTNCKCIHIFY